MNKIEIELTDSLLKLEQAITKISVIYGHDKQLSTDLNKELLNFKLVLFKLLASNTEEE